jgi:putative CocE/NonD family hydrolase
VLQAGSWYDPFLSSTLLGFTGPDGVWNVSGPERARRLVVGPWRHGGNGSSKTGEVDFGPQAAVDLDAMNLRFAAHVLGSERGGTPSDDGLPAPLRIFVMGENRWRDEREWPLARAKPTPLYSASGGHANTLDGDGLLSWTQSTSAPPDRFVYDPLDPVPTRGGNLPGATPDEPPGALRPARVRTA